MPELPEAETVGRALDRALKDRRVTRVEVFTPAMRTPLTPLLDAALEGLRFTGVRRRGRYLLADLSDKRVLLMHFGMSGVVRIENGDVPRRRHEHVFIHLDDGNIFRFECTRRFSLLEVHTAGEDGIPAVLAKLGMEPLDSGFTGEKFFECCSKRSAPVKLILTDNAVVTGIGNIYAAETLFAAGVDPRRSGRDITLEEAEKIVKSAKRILLEAVAAGGTTISDFRHVDGSEGKFVQNLKIYGKAGEPCPVCSAEVESIRQGGRSSFYCPRCQK